MSYLGSVLLPVTVSEQLSLLLDKASTNHHHPLLQVALVRDTYQQQVGRFRAEHLGSCHG